MARSIYGEGSIFQTKDGTWKGVIEVGKTDNGNRKRKAFYGKTQKEVKTKIKEFKAELLIRGQADYSKLTLAELLDEWMRTTKRQTVKPTSYDAIECTVNNQINPYIGYLQISEITPRDIQLHINLLTEKGYTYSVIKKAYNAINASLRYAANRDYIRKNPCIDISLPTNIKRDKSDIEFFTDEEVDTIIKSALYRYKTGRYMYKHGYAFVILLNTGMRIGELLALKWKNVDFESKQIYVGETRHQVIQRGQNATVKYAMEDLTPKTKSSNRYIPMNAATEQALMYFKNFGYNNPYVMATNDTGVLRYRNLQRALENILKVNKINHGSLHTFRHTFATMLFKSGTDAKVVSELLGHSDISVTYDIYIHVIESQKRKAVDVLNVLPKLPAFDFKFEITTEQEETAD